MKNKMIKLSQMIACTFLLLIITACTVNLSGEPNFVDRSKDWNASIVVTEERDIRLFDSEKESYYSVYFKGSDLSQEVPLPDKIESDEDMMQYCMNLAFGSRFIDIGSGQIQKKTIKDGLYLYCTDEAMVITDNQMLIQCADIRLQPQFSSTTPSQMKEGVLVYQADLARFSSEELKEYGQYTNWTLMGNSIQYKDGDLPLSAEGAFNTSVSSVYEKYKNSPGAIGTIGGAFTVYDLTDANCWLIIGNQFMQALDKDTGDQLLLMHPGEDLSVRS